MAHIADWFLGHCSFFSSLPTWHLESQKSIMSPSQMKGGKKLVYDFKVRLARLWHGALQRERKITLHTWSIQKKSLWNGLLGGIQSGTSHGIDGTAPGRRDTWPGQDGSWARISGHGPILRELLSHAVWRRTDGVGSTYGHATGFISVKNTPDVIPFSSNIGEVDWEDCVSQDKRKTLQNKLSFCPICTVSLLLQSPGLHI